MKTETFFQWHRTSANKLRVWIASGERELTLIQFKKLNSVFTLSGVDYLRIGDEVKPLKDC